MRQQQRFLVGLFQRELAFECSQELLLVRHCPAQRVHSRLRPPPARTRHRPHIGAHARGKLRVYLGTNDSPHRCTHIGRDGWRRMQARACALVSQCTCAGYAAPTRAVATVATPYHTLIASHTPEQDTLVYGAPAPTAVTGATPQGVAGLLDVGQKPPLTPADYRLPAQVLRG